ncbi:hypothetical protein RZE82_05940 [Mollicutes bacterium LVI A0039]|nr:hypothetical protein RZE82_05940 [Mollicutes bacterium LVI A0039]
MRIIYFVKYAVQNFLAMILVAFGTPPPLYETFYDKTYMYFTKPGDVRRAFKVYLINQGIEEKPYFLRNGFQLKADFKMSVVNLSEPDLMRIYPRKSK